MDTYESLIQELKELPNGDTCELEYAVWKDKGYKGFGPGEMALCHLENEHVVIDDLLTATAFYAGLAASLEA